MLQNRSCQTVAACLRLWPTLLCHYCVWWACRCYGTWNVDGASPTHLSYGQLRTAKPTNAIMAQLRQLAVALSSAPAAAHQTLLCNAMRLSGGSVHCALGWQVAAVRTGRCKHICG